MNESAGTEKGQPSGTPGAGMYAAVLASYSANGSKVLLGKAAEVDAEIRALTASRDRLADALRDAVNVDCDWKREGLVPCRDRIAAGGAGVINCAPCQRWYNAQAALTASTGEA